MAGEEASHRVLLAADRIRIDAASAEAFAAFAARGVECVLLKGPALTGWIYPVDEPRSYADCDLWVSPHDMRAAAEALSRIGFVCHLDETASRWSQEHASAWTRAADGVAIDMHRTLQGVEVDAEFAWRIVTAGTASITVAGTQAQVLSMPARAMYLVLHAAHHGQAGGKALIHVERALRVVDDAEWRQAAALAERLAATDSFAAGLRLVPEGVELAERLGLPPTRSVRVALHANTPPPTALGFEQLASAGWRARAAILWRKLLPPAAFVRHWWPPAAANRRMLVVGYLYRPLWLLRQAPRGLRAWREARRRVRSGQA